VKAELFQLRGLWLGLGPPSPSDQKACRLGPGDEVLLATDGVFDQLAEQGGVEGLCLEGPHGTLFDTVEERLRLALAQGPQMDDLTMVLLRRKGSPAGAPDVPV
jgi:serine phosphatase RsbU (regulator of sigma subunit)